MSTIAEIIAQQIRTGRRVRVPILAEYAIDQTLTHLHKEAVGRDLEHIIFQPQTEGASYGAAKLCANRTCCIVVFEPAEYCRFVGHAPKTPQPVVNRTQRGFAIFAEIKDSHGQDVRVQMSSQVDGPFVWIFVHGPDGKDHSIHPPAPGGISVRSPHLDRAQARALATSLLLFADGAE